MVCARNATWAGYLSKAVKPFYASQTSIFNPSDHIDTALTRCCGSLQWPDCTLSPVRDVSSKEPTGDPVDSDPDFLTAKAALSEPTVLSHKDFAILREMLTVFTHLACSRKTYLNRLLEWMLNRKRDGSFTCLLETTKRNKGFIWKDVKICFFTRCGLSSTYHLVPLALLQYDAKPTRQYDSIMLIHDSLDTEVFQYHLSTIHGI